jgi:hypothetical protein
MMEMTVRTPIGYEADLTDEGNAWLRLRYKANGEPVDLMASKEATARLDGELTALRARRWWRRLGG